MSPSEKFRALKGMKDIMPPEIAVWQKIERNAREVFSLYGFQEIRTPVLEATGIFTRSIGETTDIVEKEMYSFQDKGDRNVSLRPEGTASVVRSFIEHNLNNLPSPQKFFYMGPMFRYERPQSGRLRQFHQIGVEAFGSPHPQMDAEIIIMLRDFLEKIGLGRLRFQVNSIGCDVCRPAYRDSLRAFFSDRRDTLCPDCLRRYDRNPLRILDCKVERCKEARQGSPKVTDSLCSGCRSHFDRLLELLETLSVSYIVNPDMVRGLDYYTRTTFEVASEDLGAQNAVAAGGRYDRLVKEFGGQDTPAIGFAVGMERIVELIRETSIEAISPDVYIAILGDEAAIKGLSLGDQLRRSGLWAEVGDSDSSLKSQMRRADRLSCRYAFILGQNEVASGSVRWKRLADSVEGSITFDEAVDFLSR